MNQFIEKRLVPFFRRYHFAQPLLSLTWGIASGIAMSRDFQHTTRLVLFAFGIILFTIVLSLWSRWVRTQSANAQHNGYIGSKIGKSLLKRSQMIDWIGMTATQLYVQYILMFCLPFLFMGRHWSCFGVTIVCLLPNLWDPWWQGTSKIYIANRLILLWTLTLSVSFLYCLFFPQRLDLFYITLGSILVLYAFPYSLMARNKTRPWYVTMAPFALVMAAIGIHSVSPLKIPSISIWTKNARFALVDNADNRDDHLKKLDPTRINFDTALCCITPVVAPGVVNAFVSHQWFLDGVFIEEIDLPRLRNMENKSTAPWDKTYRTMSCKKSFPSFNGKSHLSCLVYLNHNLLIGTVGLKLQE